MGNRRDTVDFSRADQATRAVGRKPSAISEVTSNAPLRRPSGSTNRARRGGYQLRKPPCFQPGRSGNPRGRQKAVRNLGSDVKRTLETPVRLNEQGKARRVSTQEAALLRLREKALKGDARSLDRLLQLPQTFNNGTAIDSLGRKAVAAEDQAILDAYAAEVRSRPASSGGMTHGADEDAGPNSDG